MQRRWLARAALGVLLLFGGLGIPRPAVWADASAVASESSFCLAERCLPTPGLNFIYTDQPQWRAIGTASGASANRWVLPWRDVQPTPGEWRWELFDRKINDDLTDGRDPVVILMMTPDWASTTGAPGMAAPEIGGSTPARTEAIARAALGEVSAVTSPPRGLEYPWNDPRNTWGTFVRATAERYRGQVKHWVIWNEPDLGQVFWSGSTEQFVQLQRTAYLAIKAVDPTATVLLPGLAYWHDPAWLSRYLSVAAREPDAAANRLFFDVVAFNLYSTPENVLTIPAQARQTLTGYGLNPQIWVTETNVPVWNEPPGPGHPYNWSATASEQAAYVIQTAALAMAGRIERTIFFRLHDADMSESYGLVRNDGSLRPGFEAFLTVQRFLSGASSATRTVTDNGTVTRVRLSETPRGRITVLWNRSGSERFVRLPARQNLPAKVVEWDGAVRTVEPRNGGYEVRLPPATNRNTPDRAFLLGGMPRLVIEPHLPDPTLGCPLLLGNGDFEGSGGWGLSGTNAPTIGAAAARSGGQGLRLGLAPGAPRDIVGESVATQTVTIPANHRASLSFWVRPGTSDPYGDRQEVTITVGGGTRVLQRSAVQSRGDWLLMRYDLSAYAGQQLQLTFRVASDGARGLTTLDIDDVHLAACSPRPYQQFIPLLRR